MRKWKTIEEWTAEDHLQDLQRLRDNPQAANEPWRVPTDAYREAQARAADSVDEDFDDEDAAA